METLLTAGYQILSAVFDLEEISRFRAEADRVGTKSGSACVRHLRAMSLLFRDLATSARLLDLLPEDVVPVRSILFDKTPAENWPVAWHQDLTIAVKARVDVAGYTRWSEKDGAPHVQPPVRLLENMVTLRIHLDETPAENGALMVVPGSHLFGTIPTSDIRIHVKDPVICSCRAGDLLVMSPLILHASNRARVPQRRRVIHFEYARKQDLAVELDWQEHFR